MIFPRRNTEHRIEHSIRITHDIGPCLESVMHRLIPTLADLRGIRETITTILSETKAMAKAIDNVNATIGEINNTLGNIRADIQRLQTWVEEHQDGATASEIEALQVLLSQTLTDASSIAAMEPEPEEPPVEPEPGEGE